jgi:hypothetical protein
MDLYDFIPISTAGMVVIRRISGPTAEDEAQQRFHGRHHVSRGAYESVDLEQCYPLVNSQFAILKMAV